MSEEALDKEQLRILRNAFKAFDVDETGFIDGTQFVTILEMLGQKLDDKAIKTLLKEVNKDTKSKLNFKDFCTLTARFVEVEEDADAVAKELKEAFRLYDKEGKGYITVKILRDILHEIDDKLSNNDLDMIIEEIDADGSGTVDFDEFMTVMQGNENVEITITRHHRLTYYQPNPRRIDWLNFDRMLYRFYLMLQRTPRRPLHFSRRLNVPNWPRFLSMYRDMVYLPSRQRYTLCLTHY